MSDAERPAAGPGGKPPKTPPPGAAPEDRPVHGPNLKLLYGLLALALAAAIGFALLIVMPFYQRR